MIGRVIQQKRKDAGLTQAQLAELLGVTAPAVNRWEKDLSFPDATLLAPLARCLNTDLNELFSFYDTLSDKERELAIEKATRMLLEPDDDKVLVYIEETLRQNRSDGKLHYGMAKTLYGAHLLKKAYAPDIYLSHIIKYYERALELLPEEEQEICSTLMSIYASLGDREKASIYCERLQGSKMERMQNHSDMLFLLKDYPAAAEELKGLILRKVVALSVDLGLLRDILMACDDAALAEIAGGKAESIRKLFDLWEGFEILSLVSSAVTALDGEAHSRYMQELLSANPYGKHISECPLFEGVKLGGASEKDRTTADSMADLMEALSRVN